jgi:C4-dicarboxylate-specific signal transduction histidine kinase
MMIGIIITGLVAMSLIPRNIFTINFFQVGTLVEVALLSMGLAYRYKLSQDELVKKTRFIHEQSKLASMGEMLGHISHQWRQPLSEINSVAMKIETDFKKNRLSAVSLDKHIEKIEDVTEHMSETIDSFNGYFKSDKCQTLVTLEDVVNKTLSLVQESFLKSDVKVQKIVDSKEKIEIVESELVQVLLVLLNNAREAFKSSHKGIKVVTIRIEKEKKKYIIIIEDNAGGIKLENISKVFEPYYTSKFESNGVGIGLYMAKMLVEESLKGSLLAENSEKGAIFSIKL